MAFRLPERNFPVGDVTEITELALLDFSVLE